MTFHVVWQGYCIVDTKVDSATYEACRLRDQELQYQDLEQQGHPM